MNIGVPKEIKISENRVGLTESGVKQLVREGHTVFVEENAGLGASISNETYETAGAVILNTAHEVYKKSEMIVKVKEPLPEEFEFLQERQILYTFLHLAAELKLTKVLLEKKIKAIAYETIQEDDGRLPLLIPMSEVAGRLAVQIGASYLQNDHGTKGVLLGGATGVRQGRVVIIGGGVVGLNAAQIALGLGADTTILDINMKTLEFIEHNFQGRVKTLYSNAENVEMSVLKADLIVGAVLLFANRAPCLVSKNTVLKMVRGSVVMDVAVDQGGCIETCVPTSHKEPIYKVNDVIHYCVPNIPGIVAETSTYALTNATFKYCSLIASQGLEHSLQYNSAILKGLNTYEGRIVCGPVAEALKMESFQYKDLC